MEKPPTVEPVSSAGRELAGVAAEPHLPLVAAAIGLGLTVLLHRAFPKGSRARVATMPSDMGSWVWPLPVLGNYRPVVSNGVETMRGTRRHAGVDLMFKRASRTDLIETYPPGTANGTRWHFMPDDVSVLAASGGRVWSAQRTSRGYQVLLDHGRHVTLYQHLERLYIDERRGAGGGPYVDAGQPLGIVGGDPTVPPRIKHLHFEFWVGRAAIDPEPQLRGWQLVEIRQHAAPGSAFRGRAVTTRGPALLR